MTDPINAQMSLARVHRAEEKTIVRREEALQQAVEDSLKSMGDNALFTNIRNSFATLERRTPTKKELMGRQTTALEEEEIPSIIEIQSIEEIADQYQQRNPEMQTRTLLALRVRISSKDSQEEILQKLLDSYPDPFLASDALDFLIETSSGNLTEQLIAAKRQFMERYGREVLAGKNISLQAREFSQMGAGSPSHLRELYKDVTQNPRDASSLFTELSQKYTFENLKTVIAFILHSLGSDLKAKGASIEKGELARLLTEAKSMQAILGVYRFFKSRMRLVLSSFEREDLVLPSKITFETLSKMFIQFLMERFPSADKVLAAGEQLGLQDELLAELIIFSQMRDAVRQVSPRLFKSEQHRQDTLSIFLAALEKIEEELDMDEEEIEE